jgi:hypothetical protein
MSTTTSFDGRGMLGILPKLLLVFFFISFSFLFQNDDPSEMVVVAPRIITVE